MSRIKERTKNLKHELEQMFAVEVLIEMLFKIIGFTTGKGKIYDSDFEEWEIITGHLDRSRNVTSDAVVIKRGYHPNVAIPGHSINFVWIMATLDLSMERSWSDVNTQPEFVDK